MDTTKRQQQVIDRVLHYYKRYTIGNHPELWMMTSRGQSSQRLPIANSQSDPHRLRASLTTGCVLQ